VCVTRLDKCTMLALDIDIRDKNHSQGLDDALHQLRNSSCSIAFKPGIETVDNTSVHPADFTPQMGMGQWVKWVKWGYHFWTVHIDHGSLNF